MTAVTLQRRDSAKNMFRFYRLDLQPDLFGQWCFICEWGRIGCDGRVRAIPFPTANDAQRALDRQQDIKERRGYRVAAYS